MTNFSTAAASNDDKASCPTLLVDCDPGIDDAIALAFLAGEQRLGNVCLTTVTAVRGNVGVTESGRNASFMLDSFGLNEVPVVRGAADPLTPLAVELDATAFHGHDGLGGTYDHAHCDRACSPSTISAQRAIVDAVAVGDSMLALGPLTNVALAFRLDPTIPRSLTGLTVMGGAFGRPGGNITEMAEYNFHLDGLAAAEVTASGAAMTIVPLDCTERVLIRLPDLQNLSASPTGCLIHRLLDESIKIHEREMGIDGCIMHDALAAAVALDPTLVECTAGHLEVVHDGPGRGHVDLRHDTGGPVSVALDVDADRARDRILETLSRL